jgi:hypothetical protein
LLFVQGEISLEPFNDLLLRVREICRLFDDCLQLFGPDGAVANAAMFDVPADGDPAGLGFDGRLFGERG